MNGTTIVAGKSVNFQTGSNQHDQSSSLPSCNGALIGKYVASPHSYRRNSQVWLKLKLQVIGNERAVTATALTDVVVVPFSESEAHHSN